MNILMLEGLFIPLFGTSAGALAVLLTKERMNARVQCYLNQFAAGVMMAASVWSLLLPALEHAEGLGRFAFFPAVAGFWGGMFFLAWLQGRLPCIPFDPRGREEEKRSSVYCVNQIHKLRLLLFAIVIHNVPEGMAVGAVFADWYYGGKGGPVMPAFVLAAGIAIQNIPEGAIVSIPLSANGMEKRRACIYGILSGAVEPAAGACTVFLSGMVLPVMPYLLGFSAGAMIFVIVQELLSCTEEQERGHGGTFLFAAGFSIMMILDVALGTVAN